MYYHDIPPWDAIRIMRRQRPGSVERKIQEETVNRFWTLIQEFGKSVLEDIEEKEKMWLEMQKQQQMLNNENILVFHTQNFYGPKQTTENKVERLQRMRRAKSMPKMSQEEVQLLVRSRF